MTMDLQIFKMITLTVTSEEQQPLEDDLAEKAIQSDLITLEEEQ